MTTEKIMEIIYNYYPRGLSLDNGDDYDRSVEYQQRLQKCTEARKNSQNWVNFKKDAWRFKDGAWNIGLVKPPR